ncbi:MAG: adenylyl-sulfate kinase, partial [Rhodospirillales bacterium]|nr:adenylyl-sulfate kinase [Rhodospirillales bacterium]
AEKVRDQLNEQGIQTLILDGDDVRNRLHRHLGFSEAEIKENNALIAGLCESERKLVDVVLVPIISPYAESRAKARERLDPGFFEIHVCADIKVLEERDTKGLYAKARNGEMDNLIGYSDQAPYDIPANPDLLIETDTMTVDESVNALTKLVTASIRSLGQSPALS